MADNYSATSGSGLTLRTIDKGGIEEQVVIVDVGGSGAENLTSGTLPVSGTVNTELPSPVALNSTILKSVSTPVIGGGLLVSDGTNFVQPLGTAANGLDVDVTRMSSLVSGTNYIGSNGRLVINPSITQTLSVGGTYISGDYVGVDATSANFSGVTPSNGGTGTIISAILIDRALQNQPIELWMFSDFVGATSLDNAPWSVPDLPRNIGVLSFKNYYSSALNSISILKNINIGFKLGPASTILRTYLVTRGTPTYASGDLTVRLIIRQDG